MTVIDPEQLSPDDLTERLRASGALPRGHVTASTIWRRGRRHGTGIRSRVRSGSAPTARSCPRTSSWGCSRRATASTCCRSTRDVADCARTALDAHPIVGRESGRPPVPAGAAAATITERIERHGATPLIGVDGAWLGAMLPGHDEDDTLTGQVLLENLACKATAGLALRHLLARPGALAAADVRYVINCGEEAVGDRYQRGGGNVAKAVAEWAGCPRATGSDVKAFCCGPMHALMIAGALVSSGLYDDVVVLAGGSLAKLGMKFQGHVKHEMPIIEDVLAGFAVHVGRDDGISLELHNPEATEPAGSGNVPLNNYRTLASLAVIEKLIAREGIDDFVRTRGMPGFSPTQGHVASAIPYLGHALRGLTTGTLTRTMFTGKGSLFLGRMTQLSDGISLIVERNGGRDVRA